MIIDSNKYFYAPCRSTNDEDYGRYETTASYGRPASMTWQQADWADGSGIISAMQNVKNGTSDTSGATYVQWAPTLGTDNMHLSDFTITAFMDWNRKFPTNWSDSMLVSPVSNFLGEDAAYNNDDVVCLSNSVIAHGISRSSGTNVVMTKPTFDNSTRFVRQQYDASTEIFTVYIDESLVMTRDYSSNDGIRYYSATQATNDRVRFSSNTAGRNYDGQMWDIRLFDRLLDDREIEEIREYQNRILA